MEIRRNEKLNGIELITTTTEKKDAKLMERIARLGWHYSQRKGHHWHTYDEALIAATMKVFPSLDKKSKPKAKKAEPKAQKPTAPKTTKPKTTKPAKKETAVSPEVKRATFDARSEEDLRKWKLEVLKNVEQMLDTMIAELAK